MSDRQVLTVPDTPLVCKALFLGWHVAELYAEVLKRYQEESPGTLKPPSYEGDAPPVLPVLPPSVKAPRPQLQADLPGVSSLDTRRQNELRFVGISVGLAALKPVMEAAGVTPPQVPEFAQLVRVRGPEGRYQLAAAVLEFHGELLVRLQAANRVLGRAYGLGRALADVTLRLGSTDQDEGAFVKDLRQGRVDVLLESLRQLKSALPPHSAEGVAWSLLTWQAWAAAPRWDGGPLVWSQHRDEVVRALQEQGREWRLVLTGGKGALDALSAEDYVDAAGYLAGRARALAQRALKQYWPAVAVLLITVGLSAWAAVALLSTPADKGIGVAASVLTGLGIGGAGVKAALRRFATATGGYLWEAELDLAVGRALLVLPQGAEPPVIGERRAPLGEQLARRRARRLGRSVAVPASQTAGESLKSNRDPLTGQLAAFNRPLARTYSSRPLPKSTSFTQSLLRPMSSRQNSTKWPRSAKCSLGLIQAASSKRRSRALQVPAYSGGVPAPGSHSHDSSFSLNSGLAATTSRR